MELPRRERGDELLKPGEMTKLRNRVKALAPKHDLTSVIVSAFDHRTRALPFIFVDVRMVPAGVRAIGSAMADSGFKKNLHRHATMVQKFHTIKNAVGWPNTRHVYDFEHAYTFSRV